MKKLIIIGVILATITTSFAQVNFGVRTGLNISDYTNIDSSNRANIYIGAIVPINIGKVYTIQPEFNYSKQGAVYHKSQNEDINLYSDYLNLSVINKFKVSDNINIIAGPYLAIRTNKNLSRTITSGGWIISTSRTTNLYTNGESGFILGVEYELLSNFNIEARYINGFGEAIDLRYFEEDYIGNTIKTQVFQIGLNYKFKLKK